MRELVSRLVKALPGPLLLGLAGFVLFWLLSRWDGEQTARLAELDRQSDQLTHQTLEAARRFKAVQSQSVVAEREIARLRAQVEQARLTAQWLRRADSLGATVQPILSSLPDSQAVPLRLALAAKDSVIAGQEEVIHALSTIVDSLTADRDRWQGEAASQRDLAVMWKGQAEAYRGAARKGCLPLLGCVSRSAVAVTAGGLGVLGGLLAAK